MRYTRSHMKTHITLVLTLLSTVTGLRAQGGSLTPPAGPPMPVMRTLDEIYDKAVDVETQGTGIQTKLGAGETRTSVNSLPGNGTAKHVISLPGHYYLTADIFGQSTKSGIRVDAQNVVIDLNGFTLSAVAGCTKGIEIWSAGPVLIRNGTLRWWPEQSIWSNNSTDLTVQDVVIQNCEHRGVDASGSLRLERVVIKAVKEYGVHCPTTIQFSMHQCRIDGVTDAVSGVLAPNAQIRDSLVSNVTGSGTSVSGFAVTNGAVVGSTVRLVSNSTNGAAYGIVSAALVDGCSVSEMSTTPGSTHPSNFCAGISASKKVVGCSVWQITNANQSYGIIGDTVANCHVFEMGANSAITSAGISANSISDSHVEKLYSGIGIKAGAPSTVTNCTVDYCKWGIAPTSSSTVIGNSVSRCSTAGIYCGGVGNNRIVNNTVEGNGSQSTYGILSSAGDTSIFDGNTVSNCGTGYSSSGGAIFVRNIASGNCTTKFDIPAAFPVVAPTALGTNPNANISF